MRRGSEVAAVRMGLDMTFPEDGHAQLSRRQCVIALLSRDEAVARSLAGGARAEYVELTTYEELAERFKVSIGTVESVVKYGRQAMAEYLLERGLIARHIERSRKVRGGWVANPFDESASAPGDVAPTESQHD